MEGKRIDPEGIDNFADRYLSINQRILDICHDKGGLNDQEKAMLETYFSERFKQYRSQLSKFHRPPTLVITDLHGGNFFADNDIISSFFDVESAQAAPREFEIYALRFFVFNYYGASEQRLAEKAFWTAYYEGETDWPDEDTNELIDFFSVCRLLEVFQSYWGIMDGLRDTWGPRIKAILLDHIHGGSLDYLRLGDIWRERDLQPKYAVVKS